jgi:aminoglycoside phosphotransferase family enzyme/predicted kinase
VIDLTGLIEALSRPAAYPYPADAVEVRQTHISAVFLAGPFAYKVKKPVHLEFVDFSTLATRRHFCDEEVRLNRRLAPKVYLGVVPVVRTADGVRVEAEGEVIEWAVKMRRLPESATLRERLRRGEVRAEEVVALARRIASFHCTAPARETDAAGFERVAGNLRDIFSQAGPQLGATVSAAVFGRLRDLTENALAALRPLIEARAARGMTRDAHGDLRLDHAYCFPERQPPDDLVVVDCIEFNERFRFIDPVADMAFLAMDFAFLGRRDLGAVFAEAYFRAAGDEEGRTLLPLYAAYRSAVRGLVDGLKVAEKEVPEGERAEALVKARGHWLLALGELEEPGRKPCLLLVGGLPGAGKSTLARAVADAAGFTVIRSDVVRKELAGLSGEEPAQRQTRERLYTDQWTDRTYAECLRRAEELLFEGRRVLVDATFREDSRRRAFLETAARWAVPGLVLLCRAEPETVRQRLAGRRGDISDADWDVYVQAATRWEEPTEVTRQAVREVSTEGEPGQVLAYALRLLREQLRSLPERLTSATPAPG